MTQNIFIVLFTTVCLILASCSTATVSKECKENPYKPGCSKYHETYHLR